jgi:hypothetical protein
MARRSQVLALLLLGASAFAAEGTALPAASAAKEAMPAVKQSAGPERKPVEPKAAEAPRNSQGNPKAPLPVLDEKNLGLGCAQG